MKAAAVWSAIAPLALYCALMPLDAAADRNSSARLEAFSKLPDWTGLWEMGRPGGPGAAPLPAAAPSGAPPGPPDDYPYNAVWQARHDAFKQTLQRASGTEQIPDNTVTQCVWGFPRVLAGPYEFEVTVTPEQTLFNYDVREYRHIWTDGRGQPPAGVIKPSSVGHSIGHWEGETLVVDTVAITPGLWNNGVGATLSDRAHITERWSAPDKDHLQDEVTIDDPVAFVHPYMSTHYYRRVTDTNRIVQQDCFENIHETLSGDQVQTVFAPDGSDAR